MPIIHGVRSERRRATGSPRLARGVHEPPPTRSLSCSSRIDMPRTAIPSTPDQAHGLRSMAVRTGSFGPAQGAAPSEANPPVPVRVLPAARVIAITSGKGGVGKTNIAANLALKLAASDQRVILLDADLGLANAHVLLGMT